MFYRLFEQTSNWSQGKCKKHVFSSYFRAPNESMDWLIEEMIYRSDRCCSAGAEASGRCWVDCYGVLGFFGGLFVFWVIWSVPGWWWVCGVRGESSGRNKPLLVLLSQQREQRDKAAEMGHRFPGRAGRQPHWSLMLTELPPTHNHRSCKKKSEILTLKQHPAPEGLVFQAL